MAIPIVDPFGLPAPDGRQYFKVLGPPRYLATSYQRILRAAQGFKRAAARHPDPRAKAQLLVKAAECEAVFRQMSAELSVLGPRMAQEADRRIKSKIASTAVRPRSDKAAHMEERVVSRAIFTLFPSGSVGIADWKELARIVNPRASSQRPYWKAQEFGLEQGFVGRELGGFFIGRGDYSPASQERFRRHPIFEVGRGPRMTVGRPIQERRFLRDSVGEVASLRLARLEQIESRAVTALSAIARQPVVAAPTPRGRPRAPRGR